MLRNTKIESKKHNATPRDLQTAILPPHQPVNYANLTDLLLSKNHMRKLIRNHYYYRNELMRIFHCSNRLLCGAKILHKSFYPAAYANSAVRNAVWAHKNREAGCLETGFRVCLPAAICRLVHSTADSTMANTPVCTRSIPNIQNPPANVNRKVKKNYRT